MHHNIISAPYCRHLKRFKTIETFGCNHSFTSLFRISYSLWGFDHSSSHIFLFFLVSFNNCSRTHWLKFSFFIANSHVLGHNVTFLGRMILANTHLTITLCVRISQKDGANAPKLHRQTAPGDEKVVVVRRGCLRSSTGRGLWLTTQVRFVEKINPFVGAV